MRAGISQDGADALRSLVDWWQLAGVDVAVDESPRQWLRVATAPVRDLTATPSPPLPDTLPATLEAFVSWLTSAETLPTLGRDRPAPCGSVASGLMLFTDMPEAEDMADDGLVSGMAGRLLDAMLGAIGRDRAASYLAALAPGRPATGRIDAGLEAELTRIARHHVALARPRALLLLGDATVRAFTGMNLAQARGSIHPINLDGVTVPAVATFHPRFLLQQPARKADAWADLRMLMEILTK